MNSFRLLSTTLSIGACLLFSSCTPRGEDSWAHYQGGGRFVTATPSLSSDGQLLTYAAPCSGHGDIYLIKNGDKNASRLTISDDFEASPMFMPDDKHIVYVREQNGHRHIWMMNSDGSGQTQLTHGSVLDDAIHISNDGRYLILQRSEPSFGMGRLIHAYVMRLDKANAELIDVGTSAVFSPDSNSVFFSEADKLWHEQLDGNMNSRHRLDAAGQPVDVSADGKRLLIVRRPAGGTEFVGYELWAVNIEDKKAAKIAATASGMFIGAKSERVLFSTNFSRSLFVTGVSGGSTARVKCDDSYKTSSRSVLGGRGAIAASYPNMSTADCKVIFIDSESGRVATIGSLGCDGATFQSPRGPR